MYLRGSEHARGIRACIHPCTPMYIQNIDLFWDTYICILSETHDGWHNLDFQSVHKICTCICVEVNMRVVYGRLYFHAHPCIYLEHMANIISLSNLFIKHVSAWKWTCAWYTGVYTSMHTHVYTEHRSILDTYICILSETHAHPCIYLEHRANLDTYSHVTLLAFALCLTPMVNIISLSKHRSNLDTYICILSETHGWHNLAFQSVHKTCICVEVLYGRVYFHTHPCIYLELIWYFLTWYSTCFCILSENYC